MMLAGIVALESDDDLLFLTHEEIHYRENPLVCSDSVNGDANE